MARYAARHHQDRKSTRLNSSHVEISYAVFCLKKKRGFGHAAFQSCAVLGRDRASRTISFNHTATTHIYTLSLHDALPILIVFLFAALRLWRLTADGLFSDEVFSAETVHLSWPDMQRAIIKIGRAHV